MRFQKIDTRFAPSIEDILSSESGVGWRWNVCRTNEGDAELKDERLGRLILLLTTRSPIADGEVEETVVGVFEAITVALGHSLRISLQVTRW